jgi:hypothetical protein
MDIAIITDKFTPCDLTILVRDASMSQVRSIISSKSFKKINDKYVSCNNDEGEIKNYLDIKAEDFLLDKIVK